MSWQKIRYFIFSLIQRKQLIDFLKLLLQD